MTLADVGRPLSSYKPDWRPIWVIEGLWQARGVNMLCGAPRARKSTLNAYLTVCAVTGTTAFGILPVTPVQRVAVFLGEGLAEAEATRYYDVLRGLELDAALYTDRITIFPPAAQVRFDPNKDNSELRKVLKAEGYDLVTIDPLVNFHSQAENESGMAGVMSQITQFTEFATVSLIHHIPKPSSEAPERSLSHQARGHGAIAGYTAVNMLLDRVGRSEVHTIRTDAKYSEEHGSLRIMFNGESWDTEKDVQAARVERVLFALGPNTTKTDLVKALHMNRKRAFELIKELVDARKLSEKEDGTLEPSPGTGSGTRFREKVGGTTT